MPFKSIAQLHKFFQLEKEGKISKRTVREWLSKTNIKRLPKKKRKSKI